MTDETNEVVEQVEDPLEEAEGEAETSLAVVDGGKVDGECEYKDVRQQILDILAETENKTWDLAVILETAYAGDMYRSWGFSSFRDYIEQELQIQMRKAQYLVQIQEWFKKMPANIQTWIRELGWTKARMLLHVVTVENAAEWRNKVAGKTVAEIKAMMQEAKEMGEGGGGDGEGGDADGENTLKKFSASLFMPQHENWMRALGKAEEISGSDKQGNNMDLMATDFLATNAGVDNMHDFLRKAEKQLGVRIVAYSEERDELVYGADLIQDLEAKDAASDDGAADGAEYESE